MPLISDLPLPPPSNTTPQAPANHTAHVGGAWRHYLDLWALAAQVPGLRVSMPQLSHELNFDFSSYLYVEGADKFVFVDAAGPVCFTQMHMVATMGGVRDHDERLRKSILHVDVGAGGWQSLGSLGSIFYGGYAADLGVHAAVRPPPSNLTPATGWGSGSVSLPRPLAATYERTGLLEGGFALWAPICSHTRLRMAFEHVAFSAQPGLESPSELLHHITECVFTLGGIGCPLGLYTNPFLLHFPGTVLPEGVLAFNASAPAFTPSDEVALPALAYNVAALWAPERHLVEALEGGDASRSVQRCGEVALASSGDSSATLASWLVFSDAVSSNNSSVGGGTITLLWVDFPEAPYLLHSAEIFLVAVWDGGKGVLDVPFEGLLGPSSSSRGPGGQAPLPPDHAEYTALKEGRALGELPRGGCAGGGTSSNCLCNSPSPGTGFPLHRGTYCSGGLYLTLPMTWQETAEVRLEFRMNGGSIQDRAAAAAMGFDLGAPFPSPPWPPSSLRLCSSAVVARPEVVNAASQGTTSALGGGVDLAPGASRGYLQSAVRRTVQPRGMSMAPTSGTLLSIANASGSLAFISIVSFCSSDVCFEGDIRMWADGRATPSVWVDGLEDLFACGHAYSRQQHGTEPFVQWDRRYPHVHGENKVEHLFQARSFGFDAPRFQHGLVGAVEVLGDSAIYTRTSALFYGLPAPPPVITAKLFPAQLLLGALGESPGKGSERGGGGDFKLEGSLFSYSITSAPGTQSLPPDAFSLTSVIASKGLPGQSGELLTTTALAILSPNVTVSFTVPVLPGARSVVLRRLHDVAHSVAVAEVRVDGLAAGRIVASDRSYRAIDARWQEDDLALPLEATRGKQSVRVELLVKPEAAEAFGRVYLEHQAAPAWIEARWQVILSRLFDVMGGPRRERFKVFVEPRRRKLACRPPPPHFFPHFFALFFIRDIASRYESCTSQIQLRINILYKQHSKKSKPNYNLCPPHLGKSGAIFLNPAR